MNGYNYDLTVLMPARNAALYIRDAINSVLRQTYRHFEFLIINDGSTDATESIIRSYDDERIRLISRPHQGISKSLNEGLLLAAGQYIARFDADDLCLPERLEKQVNFLNAHPEYVLIGCDVDYLNSKGQHIFTHLNAAYTDKEIRNLPVAICPFIHSAVCYKKDAVLAVKGYDENAHSFEDHLLWRKLLAKGKVGNTTDVLVKARFNPESITIDERWRGRRFMQIKLGSLERGFTTKEEGDELTNILNEQNTPAIKKGSYHGLIGKKYLWNNYNPRLARKNFVECWRHQPQAFIAILWLLSFFPRTWVELIYRCIKKARVA